MRRERRGLASSPARSVARSGTPTVALTRCGEVGWRLSMTYHVVAEPASVHLSRADELLDSAGLTVPPYRDTRTRPQRMQAGWAPLVFLLAALWPQPPRRRVAHAVLRKSHQMPSGNTTRRQAPCSLVACSSTSVDLYTISLKPPIVVSGCAGMHCAVHSRESLSTDLLLLGPSPLSPR